MCLATEITPGQWKIAELVAEGHQNQEIGIRLGITRKVIALILRRIYDRTGCTGEEGACSHRILLALRYLHHQHTCKCKLP